MFSRRIPETVTGDAYKLALDIERRYFGTHLPWFFVKGGTYIEGGCYTGIKALRWHDSARKPKRILAVEIGRNKFLKFFWSNISANNLDGARRSRSRWIVERIGRRHSEAFLFDPVGFFQATDQMGRPDAQHEEPVRLLTIDDLMDQFCVDTADFLNVQVNGAEIEVLKGIRKALDRIKVLSVAAYYSQDDIKNVDVVEKMLTDRGCTILEKRTVLAASPLSPQGFEMRYWL